jgi:hypothetical protein
MFLPDKKCKADEDEAASKPLADSEFVAYKAIVKMVRIVANLM